MSEPGLRQAQDKMAAAGVHQQAIDVFTHYYRQLEDGRHRLHRRGLHRPADRSGPAERRRGRATRTPRPRWPRR